jgi:hypothetical protein
VALYSQPITERITYSARRGEGGNVELRVEIEQIRFIEETIPDGSMAGMKGHLPVPSTSELVLDLHPTEAEALWDQLGRALGKNL